MGWAGVKNGELLRLVGEHRFEILLTFDQNLRQQQNLSDRPFALVVLIVPNKQMRTIIPLVPELLFLLQSTQPGRVYEVGAP